MQSTLNLRDTDPHDVFVIEPDVSLAARPDKASLNQLYDVLSRPLEPSAEQLRPDPELRIAPDFAAGAAAPSPDMAARANASRDDIQLGETEISAHSPPTSKFAKRMAMGLFALASASGAAAWQHYGDDARAMVANWTPPFALASLASTAKPAETDAAAATDGAPAAAPDQLAAQPAADAPAAAAAAAPEPEQLQSMARDIAAMSQQISDLKATIEQLKASQAQMQAQVTSVPAKATEARLAEPPPRPRIVPPPARPATAVNRKPKQVFPYAPIAPAPPPPQAAAVQIAPQAHTAEDGGPVVRPPMPLH